VLVLPVGPDQAGAAAAFARSCMDSSLRVEQRVDGSLSARVREGILARVPYLAVIGAREEAAGAVALRRRDGDDRPAEPVADALAYLRSAGAPPL